MLPKFFIYSQGLTLVISKHYLYSALTIHIWYQVPHIDFVINQIQDIVENKPRI